MRKKICTLSVVLGLVLVTPSLALDARSKELPQLDAANRLGVDGTGNLWTWNSETGEVVLYLMEGGELSGQLGDVKGLDVDQQLGIVLLDQSERTLEARDWTGQRWSQIDLPFQARGVVWIDSETVAVAPSEAGFVLALVDLRSGKVVREMGSVPPASGGPGVVILRTTELAPDPQRGVIHALDSLEGDYWRFHLETGELIESGRVENPDRRLFQDWFGSTHDAALQDGRTQKIGIQWFRLGLDDQGRPWTVQQCPKAEGQTVAHLVLLGSKSNTNEVKVGCCALNMTIWKHRLLMVSVPGKEQCIDLEDLPK